MVLELIVLFSPFFSGSLRSSAVLRVLRGILPKPISRIAIRRVDATTHDDTVTRARAALVLTVGVMGAITPTLAAVFQGGVSDFWQVYSGAEFLLGGVDPYGQAGPGLAIDQFYGLYYPVPALWVAAPFTLLPFAVARSLFYALSAAGMAWAFSRDERDPRMLLTLSGAFIFSATFAQWEPLLVVAALTPALGFLLVAKPTVGLALWLAYPSRRAAIGCALFLGLTLAFWPTWPVRWFETASAAPTARPLALHPLGWLALVGLMRWRDGDARLVALSALVPLTPLPYSAVLLFPAVKHVREAVALIIGSWLAIAAHRWAFPYPSDVARLDYMRGVMAVTCWLPMTTLVLLRARLTSCR